MPGCVTVTGSRFSICSLKRGTTDPEEPSTFPKRTAQNEVDDRGSGGAEALKSIITRSAARFVFPITDIGFTALSVEMSTNRLTPWEAASSARCFVASVLLRQPSSGFISTIGTCL